MSDISSIHALMRHPVYWHCLPVFSFDDAEAVHDALAIVNAFAEISSCNQVGSTSQ